MRSPSEKGPASANQVKKKKEEKELGVGAYITGCLLTKPSWQAPPVRSIILEKTDP